MIKYNKLPDNITTLLPHAVNYLQSHPKVLFAYLFGSLAAGKPQPLSDVDIAVFLDQTLKTTEYKLGILGKLIDILRTDEIDLVVLNTAELPLIMNIIKNRKLIVDKSPFTRHGFESLTMRKYFDFSKKESAILHRRYMHG
jgi:predicted nucleotidyltransferase